MSYCSVFTLPQVVGLIRTLDVFTECQLRIKFLHARDSWLGTALRGLPHHEREFSIKPLVCALHMR